MTSEIRTNSLKSRAGLSTVTLTDSGPMFSGITTFVDNSTFSVGTGGTIHAPSTNTLNIGVNNTESLRIDSNSNLKIAGVCTATHFYGNGSNLTGISAGTALSGSTDNTVCTVTGANAIQGEANLTFDGDNLTITGSNHVTQVLKAGGATSDLHIDFKDSSNNLEARIFCASDQGDLRFYTGGANERLRITGDGKVGVGTDNPIAGAAGARLAVHLDDNASYAGGTARGNGIIVYNRNAGGHSSLELAQRNSANTYGSVILNAVNPADGNDYGADFTIQTRATGSGSYGERLRIDSSGRVIIGGNYTPYSGANMEIRSTDSGGDTQLRITNNATGANTKAGIVFTTSTGDYASGSIRYERNVGVAQGSGGNMGTYDALVLTAWSYGSANPWSGNEQNGLYLWGQSGTGQGGFNQAIGIGTDIPPQNTNGASGNSNGPALFCTAEGGNAITLLGRTPTPAGNDDIVGINFAARNYFGTTGRSGLTYQIICQNGHGSYGDRGQLRFNPGYNGNSNSDGKGMVMEFNGHFRPTHDNAQNLGSGSLRWNTVYAANTSINNSDINLKQNIAGLSDAEMKAASRISKIFKTYRWKESVEEKGVDKARIHTGVIAQTVKTELEAEGLDPSKYAFYCQDTGWYKDGVLLGDGITHGPGVYDKLNDETPSTVGFTSTTTYAIRYVELLSFLAAYNEQRFTSIESRIEKLEQENIALRIRVTNLEDN